jgi:hypothetical protein
VKEFLDNNKGVLNFVKTEAMWADGTSKPLPQLGQFAAFADFTMNV